ncbi:MAG: M12 family metallo-peptidase [Acidobacteria bacterium]|nr:M12 family metallo-peptidase [Acidobacteriota bacterium]
MMRRSWAVRIVLVAVAGCAVFPAGAVAECSVATDRAALAALYEATGGADWADSTNWMTDAPLDQWYGVWTDEGGCVVELSLGDNGLVGSISPELADLMNLRVLLLDRNGLTGPIPTGLGSLVHLRVLILDNNGLTGPIPPEFANLENLTDLGLRWNNLTGSIPAWLGRLVNLRTLDLGEIGLTGPIPRELGNLVNLWWLMLNGNNLKGPIPAWLGSLVNLRLLWLQYSGLTGPIPVSLGRLANLDILHLEGNELTGPVPVELGSLVSLEALYLHGNDLTGPIPVELGQLANVKTLSLDGNWGLEGPLPPGLRRAPLEELYIFVTRACAPAAWRDWLATVEFRGALCGEATDVTVDVAVVYTPAAREAAGGRAAIEAGIDHRIAETNQFYEMSGVQHRVALVHRSEVSYTETGVGLFDLDHLAHPSDGQMDEVYALRDRSGADVVHLIVGESNVGGIAFLGGDFSLSVQASGARTFAHELGHNMGLQHERYQVHHHQGGVSPHPGYGYVNQRAFEPGAAASSCWFTIMAYGTQCGDEGLTIELVHRFSNPHQSHNGDALGVPYGSGGSDPVTGPADATAVLNATGSAVALRRDRSSDTGANRRPVSVVGGLPDRIMRPGSTLDVDVSQAFVDPDGDALTYAVSSAAPQAVTVLATGARLTLTAVAPGTATIRVTATDPGGLRAASSFAVTVTVPATRFTDDPIRPGVTPVRAVHFTELRLRIDDVRAAAGLDRFRWTDPVLTAGVTRVRLVHLLELRSALAGAYAASGRSEPRWTDAAPVAGTTPIRAAHLMELRAAVLALE